MQAVQKSQIARPSRAREGDDEVVLCDLRRVGEVIDPAVAVADMLAQQDLG